jgi:hypothetical protein
MYRENPAYGPDPTTSAVPKAVDAVVMTVPVAIGAADAAVAAGATMRTKVAETAPSANLNRVVFICAPPPKGEPSP